MEFDRTVNGDGTEKFPLMIVGKFKKPKDFNRSTGKKLGFDNYSNKKGWMITELFFEWLVRFDMFIQKTKDRKFALLLDNASCQASLKLIPKLQNVEVIYIAANTTSYCSH